MCINTKRYKKTVKEFLNDYGFVCYEQNADDTAFDISMLNGDLRYGDLLCTDGLIPSGGHTNGHVEFYRDKDHAFGWGSVKSTYEGNRGMKFEWKDDEQCFKEVKEKDSGKLYTTIYRYEGWEK